MALSVEMTWKFEKTGVTAHAPVPAERWSEGAKSWAIHAKDMEAFELATARVLIASGYWNGETLRYCRKALGLRRTKFAERVSLSEFSIRAAEEEDSMAEDRVWFILDTLVAERIDASGLVMPTVTFRHNQPG
jgi:hypothetical protein